MRAIFSRTLWKGLIPLCGLILWLSSSGVEAQDAPPAEGAKGAGAAKPNPLADIDWKIGPTSVDVGSMAQLKVPEGYIYAAKEGTKKLMELTGNPPSGKELGFLSPKDMGWFVVFEFDDIGFIEEADEEELDAEDLLDSIKKGNEAANEMRKKRGWGTLSVDGWLKEPGYDTVTKNLQWAIKGSSGGKPVVNFNTRLLGRRGVMAVNLVTDPYKLEGTIPVVKTLLEGYAFKDGEKYAQYEEGDKIAKYGLAALIAGGGVALAAKTGLLAIILKFFKSMWKLIVVGVALLFGFVRKLFGGKSAAEQVHHVDAQEAAAEPDPSEDLDEDSAEPEDDRPA